jgi:hypothetical protein
MRKPKTHFEQVPVEIVRKIVEQKLEQEKISRASAPADEKGLEDGLLEAAPVIRLKGERS